MFNMIMSIYGFTMIISIYVIMLLSTINGSSSIAMLNYHTLYIRMCHSISMSHMCYIHNIYIYIIYIYVCIYIIGISWIESMDWWKYHGFIPYTRWGSAVISVGFVYQFSHRPVEDGHHMAPPWRYMGYSPLFMGCNQQKLT
jgi:hypothetical protein